MQWQSLQISTISQSFLTGTRYSTRKYNQIPSTSKHNPHACAECLNLRVFEGVCCDRQIPERPARILLRTSCLFGPLWFLSVHSKTMTRKEILRVFRPAMTSSTTSTFKRSTCSVIHSRSWWLKTLSDHIWCTWRTWTCTCHLCCIPLHHQGWPKCLRLWWAFLQIAGKSCICHISNDAIRLVPWNKFRLLIPWHFQGVPCRRGPWLLLSPDRYRHECWRGSWVAFNKLPLNCPCVTTKVVRPPKSNQNSESRFKSFQTLEVYNLKTDKTYIHTYKIQAILIQSIRYTQCRTTRPAKLQKRNSPLSSWHPPVPAKLSGQIPNEVQYNHTTKTPIQHTWSTYAHLLSNTPGKTTTKKQYKKQESKHDTHFSDFFRKSTSTL